MVGAKKRPETWLVMGTKSQDSSDRGAFPLGGMRVSQEDWSLGSQQTGGHLGEEFWSPAVGIPTGFDLPPKKA